MSTPHEIALATAIICLALSILATIAFLPGLFLLDLLATFACLIYLFGEEE